MLRVVSVGTGVAGSPFFMTHFFDPGDVGQDAQECSDWVKDFQFAARAHFGSSLVWANEPEVVTIDQASGDITSSETVTTFPVGGTASDLLPLVTQGLITWRTGSFIAGRQVIGHTFLPTAPESDNDVDGTPSSGYATAWLGSVTAADAAHPDVTHCIYSRKNGIAKTRTSFAMQNSWSYLRTRRD